MPAGQLARECCDRCPRAAGDVQAGQSPAAHAARTAAVARRRLLKAAVFPARLSPPPGKTSAGTAEHDSASWRNSADPSGAGFADIGLLPRAVSGTVLDLSLIHI